MKCIFMPRSWNVPRYQYEVITSMNKGNTYALLKLQPIQQSLLWLVAMASLLWLRTLRRHTCWNLVSVKSKLNKVLQLGVVLGTWRRTSIKGTTNYSFQNSLCWIHFFCFYSCFFFLWLNSSNPSVRRPQSVSADTTGSALTWWLILLFVSPHRRGGECSHCSPWRCDEPSWRYQPIRCCPVYYQMPNELW